MREPEGQRNEQSQEAASLHGLTTEEERKRIQMKAEVDKVRTEHSYTAWLRKAEEGELMFTESGGALSHGLIKEGRQKRRF
jgi:hypothetical protein